jgi:C4-dicarboxylate-binding protein DctP
MRPWKVLQLLLCLVLAAGAHSANAVLVIRFSHVVTNDTPKGLAAIRFKALVEKRSDQRIRVDVYPKSTLYDDQDEMLALQRGAVEILAPSLSKFGKFGFPNFELFDLPYLFRNADEVRFITEGPIGKSLLEELSRQQFVGLGYLDSGFKSMSANRPLLKPSDFKGLRMRIQPSRVIASQMQMLGARAIPLALSESRMALERGVVDGTENPLSNFITQRMNEVQTDLSLTNHGYLGYAVITNQRFWKALTESDRQLLQQAMDEALRYGNTVTAAQEDKALASVRAAGNTRIHVLDESQLEALQAAMQPVYQRARAQIGGGLIDSVLDALTEFRNRR